MRPDRTSWPRWRQTCSPGSCLARAAAGLADATIVSDVVNLEQIRVWFGRPLWEMEPPDADAYFGKVLRSAAKGTRQARSRALRVYFLFLEIRHKVEIHQLTGRVVECPIDEINRPRGVGRAALRIPPSAAQMEVLFAGWREELATCRKFAPAARNYTAARLMAEVGLRVNEASHLDLADIKWDLGRFGKLHVRKGKGARGSGPRERMVPLINNAGATLRWFVQDVWCLPRRGPHPARCPVVLFRTPQRRRDGSPGGQRDAAVHADRGGGDASAGLAGPRDSACPAALLRLPTLFGRDGSGGDPADPWTCLGRHDYELHSRPGHAISKTPGSPGSSGQRID